MDSIVALVTPYFSDGSVDLDTLSELIEWQIVSGTAGIVLAGTTGEGWALDLEEKAQMLDRAVAVVAGRVPLMMNTGMASTRETVAATRMAREMGADGALVILPYYNKPTFAGCQAHFSAVAEEGLPVMLYHHPGRTGVSLTVEQLVSLGEFVSSYKEASGDAKLLRALIAASEKPVFVGDDVLVEQTRAFGGAGVVSVLANAFPLEWGAVVRGERENSFGEILEVLGREINPQGVKALMALLGRCREEMRLPLVPAREEVREALSHFCFVKQ